MVAENPLYLQGNYNAPNAAGTGFGTTPGTDHVSAAVIADAVTMLSNNFNDIRSFMSPHIVTVSRPASTTYYRVAVISGKGLSFAKPTSNGEDHTDFGTDGGAHNFLRYIEHSNNGSTLNYRGSLVSFYTNRQAVGLYKCCEVVYSPPTRGYNFDTDFLTPILLPPDPDVPGREHADLPAAAASDAVVSPALWWRWGPRPRPRAPHGEGSRRPRTDAAPEKPIPGRQSGR